MKSFLKESLQKDFYLEIIFNSNKCKEKFTDIRGNSAIQIFFHKYICDKILIKDTLS